MEGNFSIADRARAWSVHIYTALGLPLAWLCAEALARGDASRFFVLQWIACFIDASDGYFARRWRVKEVTPGFNGRRLDDLVDFLHFTVLPLVALRALDLVPYGPALWLIVPLVASAYGFCQELAKTDDAFVGFPSYWNIVVVYFFVLGASAKFILASLLVLSALVFVPIHYVYPSKTKLFMRTTLVLGTVWSLMIGAVMLRPEAHWARNVALASLYFPTWYVFVSLLHHRNVMQRTAAGEPHTAG